MVFRSNMEMVRHYSKELLADGREHSIPEIRAYVNEKTGQRGIDGKPLSSSHIGNALRDLQIQGSGYLNTRRGYYRKEDPILREPDPEQPLQEQIYERVKEVLAETRRQIDRCFTLNLLDYPLSIEEAQALDARGRKILQLLGEAERISDPALAPEMEVQAATPAPKPAPPDQNVQDDGGSQGEPERWPRMGLTL